ncbi:MAG: Biotin carboxyl carrier protein of acetyl-CoA carboxylase [uncultured Rubrobacteraceae bacterium]|uniref:Biotin carboxyl carrier protein of acetyl-CoA carboxylase n=1 Tax=uncultured Rubrobacteraceae bacterium TaxID=349277 RepID=A0A6J4R0L0_9ACTN|nr:MAG: Biotin carboxyl carrier protein of acetyl-CoA carboxylase [uncultured Rubrobacteraceae bacterium]
MSDGATPREGSRTELPLDDVGRLVELLAESGVGEIRVRQGELEITVKAKTAEAPAELLAPQIVPQATPRVETIPEAGASAERSAERNGELHMVRSPVVGTFYRAPAPGEGPYVEVGDPVEVGQTLCIVEAMKLMNEIPADSSGEIVEILAENAKGVEYDQPLFNIRPES